MIDESGEANNAQSFRNPAKAFEASLARFVSPIGKKTLTEKPILTGVGAISAGLKHEQGKRSLASIQKENMAQLKNATPLKSAK